ncbi:methyltransferase family protein [Enterobacter sp. BNK-9]|uniref:methyltransferase family protein n=1 Tax=Enterobacter sp. BNK-9 TaxID=3376146 RepID=UPI003B42FD79
MTPLYNRMRKWLVPPVLLLLFLLFNVLVSWPAVTKLRNIVSTNLSFGLSILIGSISVYVIISSLLQLVLNKTTINALHANKAHVLITNGCYRFSRNPVYLGFAGVQLSGALLLHCIPGIFVTPLLIFLLTRLHIRYEEVAMQSVFGPAWVTYQQKTRRWI